MGEPRLKKEEQEEEKTVVDGSISTTRKPPPPKKKGIFSPQLKCLRVDQPFYVQFVQITSKSQSGFCKRLKVPHRLSLARGRINPWNI